MSMPVLSVGESLVQSDLSITTEAAEAGGRVASDHVM